MIKSIMVAIATISLLTPGLKNEIPQVAISSCATEDDLLRTDTDNMKVIAAENGVSDELREKVMDSYGLIPESVRNHFESAGWRIQIVDGLGPMFGYPSLLGWTDTDVGILYIDNRDEAVSSIFHEMGHYIDHVCQTPSSDTDFARIWADEVQLFLKFWKTDSANISTCGEYFAEFYQASIVAPEKVQKYCPQSYAYVNQYAGNIREMPLPVISANEKEHANPTQDDQERSKVRTETSEETAYLQDDTGVISASSGVTDQMSGSVAYYYNMVPPNVRSHFKNAGWKIQIVDALGPMFGYPSILGLTHADAKIIYIDNRDTAASSVIHEIGHYIDYVCQTPSNNTDFARIWADEVNAFVSFWDTDPANTNTYQEYFAEVYQASIQAPDEVQAYCPQSYAFVMQYSDILVRNQRP